MGFDIVDCSPLVVLLDVLLDCHQAVVFAEGQGESAPARGSCGIKLTDFLKQTKNIRRLCMIDMMTFQSISHGAPVTSVGNHQHVLEERTD